MRISFLREVRVFRWVLPWKLLLISCKYCNKKRNFNGLKYIPLKHHRQLTSDVGFLNLFFNRVFCLVKYWYLVTLLNYKASLPLDALEVANWRGSLVSINLSWCPHRLTKEMLKQIQHVASKDSFFLLVWKQSTILVTRCWKTKTGKQMRACTRDLVGRGKNL